MVDIKNTKYHNMAFSDIDGIIKKINDKKLVLLINQTQLMLYLNQMKKSYAFILKRTQDIQTIGILMTIVFLFINWRYSVLILILDILYSIFQARLPFYFIRKNCLEDRVFLKFALTTELAKIKKPGDKRELLYKEKSLTR